MINDITDPVVGPVPQQPTTPQFVAPETQPRQPLDPDGVPEMGKALLGLSVLNEGTNPVIPEPKKPAGGSWLAIDRANSPTFQMYEGIEAMGLSEIKAPEPVQKPEMGELWGAAFSRENSVGSLLTQGTMPKAERDPTFNPLSDENLEGYEMYADRFVDVFSREQSEFVKRNIDRQNANTDMLMNSGWTGIGVMVAAGLLDPINLIPIGGIAKKGETLLQVGGRWALAGAAGGAATETALQSTQQTRTLEESALNITGGALLGGLLGSGGTAVYRGATGKPIYGFDPDFEPLSKRLEREMVYDPDGDPIRLAETADTAAMSNPGSLSAAAVPQVTPEDFALAPSFGTADASAAIKLNPLLRLATASSGKAREIGAMLMENGMFLNRNKKGLASPVAVETAMGEYRGWHAVAEQSARDAHKAHRKSGGTMTATEFYEEVGMALRRGDQHPDANVQKAAQGYRVALEKTKQRAIEAGLLPKDVDVETAPSYLHRMWNRQALVRKPEDFRRMVGAWLDQTFANMKVRAANIQADAVRTGAKLSDDDAAFIKQVDELLEIERVEGDLTGYRSDAVESIYNTLMGYDERTLPINITAGPRGPLKERTFSIPDLFEGGGARVEDFLVNDAQVVMNRYMRVISADIELAKTFGTPDMKTVLDDIQKDYQDLIAKVAPEDQAGKKKLSEEMRARMRDIEGVRDVIRGSYGEPTYESALARGLSYVRAWNYMTMLGGMTISAFPDVAGKVLSNGFLGIARDLVGPLVTDLKGVKMAAREANAIGIAVERVLSTRIATMADIGDVYGQGTVTQRAVASLSNRFSHLTLMTAWNDVMKTADYVIASNRAIRAMGRPDRISQSNRTWLANMGIGETDYGRIMAMVRKHGSESGGMRLANPEQWEDAYARRLWIGAMGKNANIQTVTAGIGDKLMHRGAGGLFDMNLPIGQTIWQFKTFVLAGNQRIAIRMAQQGRMAEGRVLSALFTYIALGMLVYKLKSMGSGRDTSDDPVVWVREGVDRSGIAPLFMEGFNTAEKITNKTFIGESPASRFASRGAFASTLGPSVGRGEDAFAAIRNVTDGSLKDRDIHSLRKLLPYNNIFWLRTLFDEAEIAIIEAGDLEKTEFSENRQSVLE
jgi:hypothetical protein